jgi:ketosteroid isomerase-like protein
VSSQNLEFVRSFVTAWEHGDFSSAEWAHPDIDYVLVDGPAPGCWKGLAGMAEGFRTILGPWEDYRTEVDEYRALDGERVLVLLQLAGRGKRSGAQLSQMRAEPANLFHVRDGKVTRLVLYWHRERAFADLGLRLNGDSDRGD